MISILKYTDCPTCGRKHHFGLPEGKWAAGCVCDYVCPETGRHSSLKISGTAEEAKYYPQGAVQLTPQVAEVA